MFPIFSEHCKIKISMWRTLFFRCSQLCTLFHRALLNGVVFPTMGSGPSFSYRGVVWRETGMDRDWKIGTFTLKNLLLTNHRHKLYTASILLTLPKIFLKGPWPRRQSIRQPCQIITLVSATVYMTSVGWHIPPDRSPETKSQCHKSLPDLCGMSLGTTGDM